MKWNNTITAANPHGLRILRTIEGTTVCHCENKQEADLIAAAPELLHALLNISAECDETEFDAASYIESIRTIANTALAKANIK